MAPARGTTPLIALDAVVIDIETTGLDPRKARVRSSLRPCGLTGGKLDADGRVPPPDQSGRADPARPPRTFTASTMRP